MQNTKTAHFPDKNFLIKIVGMEGGGEGAEGRKKSHAGLKDGSPKPLELKFHG